MAILYISYDGMLDPLGQSQVLPYLKGLAVNRTVYLISYEKPERSHDRAAMADLRRALRAKGIQWIPLPYHRFPTLPATAFDLSLGVLVGAWYVWRYSVKLIHARGFLSAVPALVLNRLFGTRFIFDIRGFWVDCRQEQGSWEKTSLIHGFLKRLERQCMVQADVIVSLTRKAAGIMRDLPYLREDPPRFEVITTCTDTELFHPTGNRSADPFTLGYVGSIGRLYLFDEALECFKVLCELRTEARFLIVTHNDPVMIRERARALHIPEGKISIAAVEYHNVPGEIRKMDAGICFVLATPSMAAAAPTKIGEYLACGIPVLANTGPGDIAELLAESLIGVGIAEMSRDSLRLRLNELLELASDPRTKGRCVQFAKEEFSLEKGVKAYERIYRELGV